MNWVETSVENPTIFSEIHCLNADTCFAVGKGRIYRTTNGGGTLSNIQQHTPQVAEISIYPNPTSEMLYVSFHPKTTAITTLHITNSLGAVVAAYEMPPGTSRQQLDVGHLPVGVYHVSVAGLAGQRLVVVGQ